jgi:hypothetical protein
VWSSGERDLSRAHLAHSSTSTTATNAETCCVCHSRSLSAVCPLALGNEPDDRQQQPLVRRASVTLAAASPDTLALDDQPDARIGSLHSSSKRWRSPAP